MLTRIITAITALIIFIPVLFFSDSIVFDFTMAVISVIALYELLKCVKLLDKRLLSVPTFALVFSITMICRRFDPKTIIIILIVYLSYLFNLIVFSGRRYNYNDISLTFFSALYIIMAFTSILIIRSMQYGEYLYLLVFIGAWTTDTFSYFTGRLFGRHKLIPDISPKKTVEGAIGGIFFCALAFIIYGAVVLKITDADFTPDYLLLGISGAVISVFAIIGDLSASAIKRYYDCKDFGSIFPGHGGILDRFDSVMGVAPILTVIAAVFVKINNYGLFV